MISPLGILLIGFFVALINDSLGLGYGTLSSVLLIASGMGTALASAAIHTAEIFAALFSGISHGRMGNIDRKIFVPLAIAGILGGATGAYAASRLANASVIKPFVALVLLVLGTLILIKFTFRHKEHEHQVPRKHRLLLIGFPAGFIDAISGGGWGPVTMPTLILHNAHPKKAIGSSLLARFFVTVTIAIVFFFSLPKFDWGVVIPLVLGSLAAAPFSAWFAKKMPSRILGIAVGLLVMALSVRTIVMAL